MDNTIDCACVIHGNYYSWQYVENLHHMLTANLSVPFRLHVFTEADRLVPDWAIHHALQPWPDISGPKKAWWYKMQLFDPAHGIKQLLYFDLDVIITKSLDWVMDLDRTHFWAIRDFIHLWRPHHTGINSSMMYWNCEKFQYLWTQFAAQTMQYNIRRYHGDQDWLNAHIQSGQGKCIASGVAKSWRWQLLDGGLDVDTKRYRTPGTGTMIDNDTCLIVFHGQPKPHEIQDPVIMQYWSQMIRH